MQRSSKVSAQSAVVISLDPGSRWAESDGDDLRAALDGHRVIVAPDEDAWKGAIRDDIDCAVVVGGDQAALDRLKSLTATQPAVGTVFLAPPDAPECVEQAYDAGADEVVPGDDAATAAVVARHVERFASVDDARADTAPPHTHLRKLLDAADDAILTIDTDSIVQYASGGLSDILGYEPETVVGERLTMLMDERAATGHLEGLAQYLRTGDRSIDWNDVELTGQHRNGESVPLSVSFAEVPVGEERYFTGIVRDISERKRGEQQLAQHDAVMQTVSDGIYALDDEGRFLAVNDAYVDLLGYDRSTLLGEPAEQFLEENVSASAQQIQRDLEAGDDKVRSLETTLETADGSVVPIEARISLYPLDDERIGRVGVVRDITDRRRHQEQLAELNAVARALTAVETTEEAVELIVEAAQETLDLPITAVELFDEEAGRLASVARTERATELAGEGPFFTDGKDIPWRVYSEREARVVDDMATVEGVDPAETPLGSAIVYPIGPYGVFITGATETNAFGSAAATIASILTSNLEATLERVDREQELRAQKERLEARNESLERVERINGVIRNITQSLVHATSRGDIESAVCAELTHRGPYKFAWIAEEKTVAGTDLITRSAAGEGDGYLDAVSISADPEAPEGSGPTGRAMRTHEPQVQENIHSDPPFEPWRTEAIERDFRSSVAVPIVYGEKRYGVLNIYADETGMFGDLEESVLAELGEMVGYAINAMERKKMLVSDASVALEFELDDRTIPAIRFASETGSSFEFDELVQRAEGGYRVFFGLSGTDAETVYEFTDGVSSITDLSFISEQDGVLRFEAAVSESGFFGQLLSYGGYPRRMSATASGARVEVELPRTGDVQSFVRMFLESYDGAELVARKERDRPVQTREEFEAVYKDVLTNRQEEVLKTAYFSGFFEWPREHSGQDIAEMLDVSQPTVNRHIRNSERKLMDLIFDDEVDIDE